MSVDLKAEIEALRAGCPELRIDSVSEYASGQFNRAVLVNSEWIFRFPRYPQSIAELEVETQLLQSLRGRLPLAIPDPIYTRFEPRVPGQVFAGYRRLPGEPLYRSCLAQIREPARLDHLAVQLVDFLRSLHATPLTIVPPDMPNADGRAEWAGMYERVKQHLFPAMRPDARAAVTAHFETFLSDPALHDFLPALRHGDFGGSNILYDPTAGQISGVIDFSFCAPGDPAVDLAAVSTLGEGFYARILDNYTENGEIRARMEARARFYRGTFALQEALSGLDTGDEASYHSGMEQYR